ncbi:MAG TPA: thioesterase family protein [Methylomirabilota bacterium]|jgi:predicted thioesterase
MPIEAGLVGSIEVVVQPADTADALGNTGLHVLATPRLVSLLELAAIRAVEAHLPPGGATVGTRIDVRHLAATPVGMRATIRATLREVDGRRLVFDIEGHDETERIVEGTHERFQIDQARFLARIAAKGRPG